MKMATKTYKTKQLNQMCLKKYLIKSLMAGNS